MRILYECERLAVLEENDKFIVQILDNYRIVKELITSRNNLISTLLNELNQSKEKLKSSVFGKNKEKCSICLNPEIECVNQILNFYNKF